jgi:uncharacterized protein (DUF1800 family)
MLRERTTPELVAAAHLARRATLSGSHTLIERLSRLNPSGMVQTMLDAAEMAPTPPVTGDDWSDLEELIQWWTRQLSSPEGGLGERMAWFWHGVLTTSADKVDSAAQVRTQLELLRSHSLGNYRELLQGFMVDGALLNYLDGNGSVAYAPNENLARESMELFTLGWGNYSEDDVRSAARALAGWYVDYDTGEVEFSRQDSFRAPIIFLGEQRDWDTPSIVDRLCDDPATAIHVASRLWQHLVGAPLDSGAAQELGDWWQGKDLEIKPLVSQILMSEGFSNSRMTRVRTGLEWYCAARAIILGDDTASETEDFPTDTWRIQELGQLPYDPPNVAGWPTDDRWVGPSGMLARASIAHDIDFNEFFDASMTTAAILDRCGLHEVSDETTNAIANAGGGLDPESRLLVRFRLALTCPEFNQS